MDKIENYYQSTILLDDIIKSKDDSFNEIHEKVLIDEIFPENFADNLSQLESFNKHLARPNTYLHKWWARRCGSTFRTILKQFVSDRALQDYYSPGGLEGKVILDPMMGGGTTLHEAIRLGARVIGADIDLIPTLQVRATLSKIELNELKDSFKDFFNSLYKKIGHYFHTECPCCHETVDSQYTLHGLRKKCLCGEVIQIDQYEIRQETDKVFRICPNTYKVVSTHETSESFSNNPRLITKKEKSCAICKQKYQDIFELPFYKRYVPLVVVGTCPQHGLFFREVGTFDLQRIQEAEQQRHTLDFGDLEDFIIREGPKSKDLLKRGIKSYLELFSARQILYLYHSIELIRQHNSVTALNLALLVSTSLEFNAMLCGYKGWMKRRPGAIRHVFGLHAYVFQYTVAENNPVSLKKSSGNLQLLFHDRIIRGREWSIAPIERKIDRKGKTYPVKIIGEIDAGTEVFEQSSLNKDQTFLLIHGDSRKLPITTQSVDIIVTDPPYYDSVQYSDLAVFFRVWLKRLLPNEANWHYDDRLSAVAIKSGDNDTNFLAVMSEIFLECARILKSEQGRLIFTFHHWDSNAWAELTISLMKANFQLQNYYVVFSENPISAHINNLKSIKHDAILVLASKNQICNRKWESLESIDTLDSQMFCRQCSKALGWLLETTYSPKQIREIWKTLIKT